MIGVDAGNVLVNDRTHALDQDLDWVPARMKRWRWPARARVHDPRIWFTPLLLVPLLGELLALTVFEGFTGSGDELLATYDDPWLQNRLSKFGARVHTLATLDQAAEGELVLVQGRVACEVPLHGALRASPGVCRRLAFRVGDRWFIHEAAVDFRLVGKGGESVQVHAAGARFITCMGGPMEWPASHFIGDQAPHGVRACYDFRTQPVQAAERVLQIGELVTVIGHVTSVVDPAGVASGYREQPRSMALAGSSALPLLIVRSIELGKVE